MSGFTKLIPLLSILCLVCQGIVAESWEKIAGNRSEEWFRSEEGLQIVQQVIAYQYPSGGWPKNIDMAKPTAIENIQRITEAKDYSTIDNGATYSQIHFLCKAFSITGFQNARESALRGLEYLFESQYDTGGWPVFYPRKGSYYGVIHYNDNSVVGVLKLLKDICDRKPEFNGLPPEVLNKAKVSLNSGIDCILKSQVIVDGKPTVWCAQHDPVTLEPAAARTFEPISLSGAESAYLTLFLMSIPEPEPEVIRAVNAAVEWFTVTAIPDAEVRETTNAQGQRDRIFVRTKGEGPLWARFYEIGSNRPIFAGRDKVIHYKLEEIEHERRIGYGYYSTAPQKVLKNYTKWKASLDNN